jgi:hypothetical protein
VPVVRHNQIAGTFDPMVDRGTGWLMLAAFVVALRSLALICGGQRTVALENLARRQELAVFKRTVKRPRVFG